MSKKFNINLEELTEEIDQVDISEINDSVIENEENANEIDQGVETIVSLESISKILEGTLDNGGLNYISSKITNVSLEALYKSVGIKTSSVSFENLDTSSLRLKNTKLAIEGIGSKIVSIFKAIISAIKRGIIWIQKFIRHLFNKFEGYKDKVKTLRLALIKSNKETVEDKDFQVKNIIKFLKPIDNENMGANLNNFTKFLKTYFPHTNTEAISLVNNIKAIIDVIPDKDVQAAVDKHIDIKPFTGMTKNSSSDKDGNDAYVSEYPLPDDAKILISIPKNGLETAVWDKACRDSGLDLQTSKKDEVSVDKIKIASKDEINKMLTNLEELCNIAINSKKEFNSFVSLKNTMVKDLDSKVTAYTKSDSDTDKGDYVTSLSSRMRLLDNVYVNGSVKISNFIVKVLNAYIGYTEHCVKAYA